MREDLTHLSEGPVSSGSCGSVPLCAMKKLVTLTFTLFSDPGFLKETHSHSHQSMKEQHTNWTRTTQRLIDGHSLYPRSVYTVSIASQYSLKLTADISLNIISPSLAKSLCAPPFHIAVLPVISQTCCVGLKVGWYLSSTIRWMEHVYDIHRFN